MNGGYAWLNARCGARARMHDGLIKAIDLFSLVLLLLSFFQVIRDQKAAWELKSNKRPEGCNWAKMENKIPGTNQHGILLLIAAALLIRIRGEEGRWLPAWNATPWLPESDFSNNQWGNRNRVGKRRCKACVQASLTVHCARRTATAFAVPSSTSTNNISCGWVLEWEPGRGRFGYGRQGNALSSGENGCLRRGPQA
jgi:hypothetical protein